MSMIRLIAALALTAGVSACATTETATRNVQMDTSAMQASTAQLAVQDITVSVPQSLRVSEANLYYPNGDIVWREDPKGDRHAQVQTIVENAMLRGVSRVEGTVPVNLHVEVARFHALTEKARYTIGGVHAIHLNITLVDPATGRPLTEPRFIKANLNAFGGQRAIDAEAQGLTQKVRITEHLAGVIQRELANPAAFQPAANFLVAAN